MTDLSATLSARMQQALNLSRSKAAIDLQLRTLPAQERQAVLLDLLAAYELEASPAKAATVAAIVAAPVSVARAHKAPSAPAKASEPEPPTALHAAAAEGSLSDRLLAILREQPESPIELLAQTLCGATDNANRNRVSTTLSYLKRRGKVRNVGPGKWRIVESKRSARPKAAPKAAPVEEAPAPKPERASTAPSTPLAAERVRTLLADHSEGLTTGQIRDLLGPNRPRDISTVVAKMAGRGILVASGKKGAFTYKLSQASSPATATANNG